MLIKEAKPNGIKMIQDLKESQEMTSKK